MSDSASPKRRRCDVTDIVGSNVVGLQNVIGKTSILYDVNFLKRDIRLIEVTEDILKSIRENEILKIIGPVKSSGKAVASDAVLTSNDKTFSIKKVETSNAVYIVNPSSSDVYTIQSASQDYYELKNIPPRMERISEMLKHSLFDGSDTGSGNQVDASCLLSYDDLRNEIQASDKEFSNVLFSLGVVELRGKMRLLSKTAIAETTKQLIYTIIEKGWDIDHVSQKLCESSIPQTDPVLLAFSLKTLCSKTCSKAQDEGTLEPGYWVLDKDTISKATAHNLFQSQSDPTALWECEDFLRTWDAETPGGNAPQAQLLDGIAITMESKVHKTLSSDGSTVVYSYRYLPSADLSDDLHTRLEQLFSVRQMFTEGELLPYFLDMIGQKGKPGSVAELLLPHTRLIDDNYLRK